MITKEDLEKVMKDHQLEIENHFIEEVKRQISHDISYTLQKEISETVKAFYTENVLPEVQETLVGSRSKIVESIAKDSEKMSSMVSEMLIKEISETLASSYKRSQIVKALFGA